MTGEEFLSMKFLDYVADSSWFLWLDTVLWQLYVGIFREANGRRRYRNCCSYTASNFSRGIFSATFLCGRVDAESRLTFN